MSDSLLKGNGLLATAPATFQLLDPALVYGTEGFKYDFYIKCVVDGNGSGWERWDGVAWEEVPGGAEVVNAGDESWARGVLIDEDSTGLVRLNVDGGSCDYWYAINGGISGGGYPSILSVEGISSTNAEFYVRSGRAYSVTSDGVHSWEYAIDREGTSWAAFDEGSSSGFGFTAPPSCRVRMVPTGAVTFKIDSTEIC